MKGPTTLMTYPNESYAAADAHPDIQHAWLNVELGHNLARGEVTASGKLGTWFRGRKLSE